MANYDPFGLPIGRNSPCWCQSGKKFKKCHGKAVSKPPLGKLDQSYHKGKASNKYCMHPNAGQNCAPLVVRAHSIRKSGDLKTIQRNGHVYMYSKPSLQDLDKTGGRVFAKLTGVNGASTFTGMCSLHDTELFAPLETREILPDKEQLALLMYRAHLKELFHKRDTKYSDEVNDAIMAEKTPIQQLQAHAYMRELEDQFALGARDIEYIIGRMNANIDNPCVLDIDSIIVEYASELPYLCSASFAPAMGLDGQLYAPHLEEADVLPRLSMTAFNENGKGFVVFSWLSEHRAFCHTYVRSLLSVHKEAISSRLFECAVRYAENICFGPEWFDNRADECKKMIDDAMNYNTDTLEVNAYECWYKNEINGLELPGMVNIRHIPDDLQSIPRSIPAVSDLLDIAGH